MADSLAKKDIRLLFSRLSAETARSEYLVDIIEWMHGRLQALEADAGITPDPPPTKPGDGKEGRLPAVLD